MKDLNLNSGNLCNFCGASKDDNCTAESLADCIAANGGVLLPCRIGQTVFVCNKTAGRVFRNTVVAITVNGDSRYKNDITLEYHNIHGEISRRRFKWAQIGRQLFFTKEDAVKALQGDGETVTPDGEGTT